MSIQIGGAPPGFRFWAIVSSAVLGLMCVLAGACVMHMRSLVELHGIDYKQGMLLGMRAGLGGFAVVWCGYMALLAVTASASRWRVWLHVAMVAWVIVACYCMFAAIHGWYWTMFGGMRGVM